MNTNITNETTKYCAKHIICPFWKQPYYNCRDNKTCSRNHICLHTGASRIRVPFTKTAAISPTEFPEEPLLQRYATGIAVTVYTLLTVIPASHFCQDIQLGVPNYTNRFHTSCTCKTSVIYTCSICAIPTKQNWRWNFLIKMKNIKESLTFI